MNMNRNKPRTYDVLDMELQVSRWVSVVMEESRVGRVQSHSGGAND